MEDWDQDIRPYLMLMFIIERSVSGYLRWGLESRDFPALHSFLLERQARGAPNGGDLLGPSEVQLALTRAVHLDASLTALGSGDLSQSARDRLSNALSDACTELQAAIDQEQAALVSVKGNTKGNRPGAKKKKIEEEDRALFTLGDLEIFLRRARARDKGPGLQSKQPYIAQASVLIETLRRQRNAVMHGDLPSVPLRSTAGRLGILDATSLLFFFLSSSIPEKSVRACKDELFDGYRYLALTAGDLENIIRDLRVEQELFSFKTHELIFYLYQRPEPNLDPTRPLQYATDRSVWVCRTPRAKLKLPAVELERELLNVAKSWPKNKKTSYGARILSEIEAAPAPPPVGSASKRAPSDDIFGVPLWKPLGKKESQGYLAVEITKKLQVKR
jgi:hypothetical protein